MRRGVKITLVTLTVLVVGIVAVAVGVIWFLKTPAGARFVLDKVKEQLAKNGMKMEYRAVAFDPFHHLHFDDLHVSRELADDKMDVTVKTIDASYAISFLGRAIDVENVTIDSPTVFMRTASKGAAPSDATPAPTGDPIGEARKIVLAPPARLTVKNFSLEKMKVDVEVKTAAMAAVAKLAAVSAHAKLAFEKERIVTSGDFDIGTDNVIDFSQGPMSARLAPVATAKWSAKIEPRDGRYVYEVEPSDFHFSTAKLSYKQGPSDAAMADVKLDSHLKVLARSKELFQLDPNSLESVGLTNIFSTGRTTYGAFAARGQSAVLDGALAKDLSFKLTYAMTELSAPNVLTHPTHLSLRATGGVARDFTWVQGEGATALDDVNVATFSVGGKAGAGITLDGQTKIASDLRLANVLKAGAAWRDSGAVHADAEFTAAMKGELKTFLDLQKPANRQLPVEALVKATVSQTSKPRGAMAATMPTFDPLAVEAKLTKDGEKMAFATTSTTKSLTASGKRLRDVNLKADGSLEKDGSLNMDGRLRVGHDDAAAFKGNGKYADNHVALKGTFDGLVADYIDGMPMRDYGKWSTKTELDLNVDLPKQGSFMQAGTLALNGGTTVTQVIPAKIGGVSLPEPIALTHQVDLQKGLLTADLGAKVPTFTKTKTATVKGIEMHMVARSPDAAAAKDLDIVAEMKTGRIEMSAGPPMAGAGAKLRAAKRGDRFTLDELKGDVDGQKIKFDAEATGKVKAKEFIVRGNLFADLPKGFTPVAGQTLAGHFSLPWTVSIFRGREINLEGTLAMKDVAYTKPDMQLRAKGISGRVPVSEKFIFDGKVLRFAHLITQNAFERVDFERLRPLIHGADQAKIEEVGYEDKVYGPFVGYFSMKQNLVFAHQFDATLGTSGLAYGEMTFDFYPANLQLGFLARLTALNLTELLPKKYLTKIPKGDKNVSGRAGMVINLNRGSVDGRMDITEIGSTQLILMVNILDPTYENDRMNLARTALGYGYPTFVQIAIQQGYMDMGMDVSLVGITKHFDVRDIPVSGLISSATADIVKKAQGGPLK